MPVHLYEIFELVEDSLNFDVLLNVPFPADNWLPRHCSYQLFEREPEG